MKEMINLVFTKGFCPLSVFLRGLLGLIKNSASEKFRSSALSFGQDKTVKFLFEISTFP